MVLAAFSYHCYEDPVSSDVELKYSLCWGVSLSQAHRSLILWTLPAVSAAAPPVLTRTRHKELLLHFSD